MTVNVYVNGPDISEARTLHESGLALAAPERKQNNKTGKQYNERGCPISGNRHLWV